MLPTDPTGEQPPAQPGWTLPPPPSSPYVGVPDTEPGGAAPRRSRRLLKVSLAVVGTVVLVGVPSAVALFLAMSRGSGDQLIRTVPANADIYVTVELDPSLSQKRNLESFLEHFPKLRSQDQIRKNIDSSLSDSVKDLGLDYKRDVQPWLGNQVAMVARVDSKGGAAALVVRSTDDAAAARAVDRIKSGHNMSGLHWSTQAHGGVSVTVGRYSSTSASADAAYAVFDHVAVLASDPSIVDAMIDTDHGRQANLGTVQAYRDTLAQLPDDHIGVAYVNAASLVRTLKKMAGDMSSAPDVVRKAMDSLDAYRTMGMAVSAQSDAMALDAVSLTDPSKLSAAQRTALSTNSSRAAALGWVPRDSYGVIAATRSSSGAAGVPLALAVIGGLTVVGRQTTSTFQNISNGLAPPESAPTPAGGVPPVPPPSLDQVPVTPPPGLDLQAAPPPNPEPPQPVLQQAQPADPLQQLGLDDPHGIASHLTGDAAVAVGPGHGSLPVSAVLAVGTDQAAAMQRFLDTAAGLAGSGGRWTAQAYGGAVVHTLHLDGTPFAPSYTVLDGYGLVATDPGALRAAVDAHRGAAPGIDSSPSFSGSAAGHAAGGLVFIDFPALFSSVESALGGSDRADFDRNTMPDVRPLRTLVVTSTGNTRVQSTHVVLTVGG